MTIILLSLSVINYISETVTLIVIMTKLEIQTYTASHTYTKEKQTYAHTCLYPLTPSVHEAPYTHITVRLSDLDSINCLGPDASIEIVQSNGCLRLTRSPHERVRLWRQVSGGAGGRDADS